PDQRGRVRTRQRSRTGPRHPHAPAHGSLPAAGRPRTRRLRRLDRTPAQSLSTGVNMAKPSALSTLADLAQNDTDSAARELGRLQGLRTQAEQQLAALTQYPEEYRNRMQDL